MRRVWWLVSVLVAGCVSSNAEQCPDGTVCPVNSQCDLKDNGDYRCLSPASLAACDGVNEGENCTIELNPGSCRDGSCELWFCGDGFLTPGEQCDGTDLGDATCTDFGYYA